MKFRGVGATTHIDRHYMKMSKEALDSAARQVNNSGRVPAVGLDHDITVMPLGKVIEAKVEPLEDGEYQLVIVQEIFDNYETIILADGTKLIEQKSASDNRPFVREEKRPDKIELSYDMVNFASKDDLREFISEVKEEMDFQERIIGRKSLIPDPEIIIHLTEGAFALLVGNKIVNKVADKLLDNVLDDVNKLYSFVKKVIVGMARYSVPKNRPVTYVFIILDEICIELIARSNNADFIINSISKESLEKMMKKLTDLKERFSIDKIQFVLNNDGDWEFNFLLTKTGTVIGTERSLSKRAKKLELLFGDKD